MSTQSTNILTLLSLVTFTLTAKLNNNAPLIGIIAQPASSSIKSYPDAKTNYVMTLESYTDWIEQAGGIPVLLPYDMENSRTFDILENL